MNANANGINGRHGKAEAKNGALAVVNEDEADLPDMTAASDWIPLPLLIERVAGQAFVDLHTLAETQATISAFTAALLCSQYYTCSGCPLLQTAIANGCC